MGVCCGGVARVSADSVLTLLAAFDAALAAADPQTVPAAAATLTGLLVAAVPGAEQASVTAARHGAPRTVHATGAMAAGCEDLQRALGSGPTVDALAGGVGCVSDGLHVDGGGAGFGGRACREFGAVSVLSVPLYRGGGLDDVTAFTVYSSRVGAFDDTACTVAAVLARPSAQALALAAHRDVAVHLQCALASDREIGAAMGILIATRKLTRAGAFDLLVQVSRTSGITIADLATEVADTGYLQHPASR